MGTYLEVGACLSIWGWRVAGLIQGWDHLRYLELFTKFSTKTDFNTLSSANGVINGWL